MAKSGGDGSKIPTKSELLAYLKSLDDGDKSKPLAVRELFEGGDLTLKTETPPRMVIPLVRMKIIEAAASVEREDSLIEVFIREYDRRMVSVNRKGRLELLGALQALAEAEGGDEVPLR